VQPPGVEQTDMGWEVYADGLRALLVRVHEEYRPGPLYVTENGAAYSDVRSHDGAVRDPERIEYLERHVAAVEDAVAESVPVCGYFVWSFLDNFEWAWGYSRRFGLVFVDYATLERVPKASFGWYRSAIDDRRNGVAGWRASA
jgi:beta-glucosidase